MPKAFRQTLLLCMGAAVALTTACKPKPPVPILRTEDGSVVKAPPPPDTMQEDQAKALATQAEQARAGGDVAKAKTLEAELLKKYPATLAAAELFLAQSKQAEDAGDVEAAIENLEKLLFYRPSYEKVGEVREHYASLLIRIGRMGDAVEMLRPLFAAAKDGQTKARLGTLLATAIAGRTGGDSSDDAREALEIHVALRSSNAVDATVRRQSEEAAIDIVSHGLSFATIQEVWEDVKGESSWKFLHPILLFKLAKTHYHVRDYEAAEDLLKKLSKDYADSDYGQKGAAFLERLENRFKVNPKAIGVVLPLSGRLQQYGERALAAVRLGLGEGYEVIVKDSGGDATMASDAVESLVLDHHVVAIVGPLFSKSSAAAATKAEELSVPLVSLSYRSGLPEIGEYVFRSALTVKAQAQYLAKVAFERLGMTRFAILHPQTGYGNSFAQAFWDEVEKRKGEIRGIESYEYDQTTFATPVRRLVGRFYHYSRPEYIEELRRLRAQKLPSHRFRAALEDYVEGLPPVVDFDAIVIPDSGKKIGLIAPALAFEDIVLTHDERMLETIRRSTRNENLHPVTLIGGSTWNSQQTIEGCERYCENAVFVDGYFQDNPSPEALDFVAKFREKTGATPTLMEAQAFDTGTAMAWVLSQGKPKTRKSMRALLLEMPTQKGVTGTWKFDGDGEAMKDLFVLTIKKRSIQLHTSSDPEKKG